MTSVVSVTITLKNCLHFSQNWSNYNFPSLNLVRSLADKENGPME